MNCLFSKSSLFFVATFAIIVLITSGCGVLSSEPYIQTTVYDLGVPASINKSNLSIEIKRFRTEGPYKSKMVLRRSGNMLDCNDYKKWARAPELMLARYLTLALENTSANRQNRSDALQVSGTILVFEANEINGTVSMVVNYKIQKPRTATPLDSGRASFSVKVGNITSESISMAMSENAAQFAELLRKEINKIQARK